MHPVEKGFPVHAGLAGGVLPGAPLHTIAMARSRRLWVESRRLVARTRSSAVVRSIRVVFTAAAMLSSCAANRPLKTANPDLGHLGITTRQGQSTLE